MNCKPPIVIGKPKLGVIGDFPVCIIERTTPDSCCALHPERGLPLFSKSFDKECLHHAVNPQNVEILKCFVVACPGASRTNWRTTPDLCSFNQGKSYQNPQRAG
jgi:hypothetical protein